MKLKTLLAVAAISIATLPTNVALAQVKKEEIRFVPSGKSRQIGFFSGAYSDCSVWNLKEMDVRVTKAPENGTVELTPGESFLIFPKDGTTAHCSGKKYRGTAVNYKSSAGFTGTDELKFSRCPLPDWEWKHSSKSMCGDCSACPVARPRIWQK